MWCIAPEPILNYPSSPHDRHLRALTFGILSLSTGWYIFPRVYSSWKCIFMYTSASPSLGYTYIYIVTTRHPRRFSSDLPLPRIRPQKVLYNARRTERSRHIFPSMSSRYAVSPSQKKPILCRKKTRRGRYLVCQPLWRIVTRKAGFRELYIEPYGCISL